MLGVLIIHVIGLIALFTVVPSHPAFIGMGIAAYVFGVRHAFDIDHIAAVDNTIRKLIAQKKDSRGVGFFFSLGHSTVVFLLAVLTAISVKFVAKYMPSMQDIGGIIGVSVSGVFLVFLSILNLMLFVQLWKTFRKMKEEKIQESDLEKMFEAKGFFTRYLGSLFKVVTKSWHIYPIGFLFGLGFDTATEISLLTMSAGAANNHLPVLGIIALPLLFAAGMSLFDTLDGLMMTKSYAWANDRPVRKVYYNLIVTAISVVAALAVGIVELAQITTEKLHLSGGVWDVIASVDFGNLGYFLVVAFLAIWGLAVFIWKYYKIEERYTVK
ncbi:HoxN/HupN/NixA family nickel/cobalt transporter [Paenibacillus chibensis]|uniref:Nickel/cobalt efflux system n=2 Tax=Paenibacillus chibensis TaxID=59846 RepID=A0ABU6PSM7_9BACL|nr:HoxN/HupN/NixA family nickel/cobalt transporter [Paenibacillus chibensis]MEC0370846.1 HoxN/HupN/NixA family nickel/cobalt transporter [Paenibacillus chibensis]MED5017893.1 HoxN/HupN/NixA family nickel/cobalt transporter [Paenibacillus chibensis]